jgi:ferrous iron transport protein B
LTGLHQHIGNWPGKTVERAEGTLYHGGYTIDVIDLPGIYSLSTFSMEELISREYIAKEKPDVVINVIDATTLERNLFFTLQLLELERPMVIALNQMDLAKKRGIAIDIERLQKFLEAVGFSPSEEVTNLII